MYEIFTHVLSKDDDRHTAASDQLAATEHGHSLKVELLLGGIALPGCLEYDARVDRVTFMLSKKASSPPGGL